MNSVDDYLNTTEIHVKHIASCILPTRWGNFQLHGFQQESNGQEHVALSIGNIGDGLPVTVRIHSECLTGDTLFSLKCDCGPQLAAAMEMIGKLERGLLIYLRQEGRGIGLINKIRAYHLQDQGLDTVEANLKLGLPADARNFSMLKDIFSWLNVYQVKLLTNNPQKVEALKHLGVEVKERIPLIVGRNTINQNYLDTKAKKFGHWFS